MPYDSPPASGAKHPILYVTLVDAWLEWHPGVRKDEAMTNEAKKVEAWRQIVARFRELAAERPDPSPAASSAAAVPVTA